MADTERAPLPPYMPYKSLGTFVDHLRAIGIPSHIDKSVMASMSGAMQSWLKAALRYMKLIDAEDVPTDRLVKLVNAEGDERKALLVELFKSSYGFLNGKIDLKNTTPTKLRAAIVDLGAQGETVEKIMAFMIAMGKEAGIPLSPLLTKRAPSVRRPRQRPPVRPGASPDAASATPSTDNNTERDTGTSMKSIELPEANGFLVLSGNFNMFDLAGDERDLVFTIIDKMKAFEAAHPPEEDES